MRPETQIMSRDECWFVDIARDIVLRWSRKEEGSRSQQRAVIRILCVDDSYLNRSRLDKRLCAIVIGRGRSGSVLEV